MKSVLDLNIQEQNVLVVGKGPSVDLFNAYTDYDAVFTVNQATEFVPCRHFAFFLDLEPFLEVADKILVNKKVKVFLPLYPNIRNINNQVRRSKKSLLTLRKQINAIEALMQEERLYYYNTEAYDRGISSNNYETFAANFVSATVLIQILHSNKCSTISLTGFDGGNGYSSRLSRSKLRSLTHSFDKQFEILKKFNRQNNFPLRKVGVMLNIYVGAQLEQYIPARVLEYSIRKHTLLDVNVMRLGEMISGTKFKGRTPFSGQRFEIPKLNKFIDKAVYLDSDMLVFHDISDLLEQSEDTAVSACRIRENINRKPQYSVMVIDCEKARWDTDIISAAAAVSYDATMFDLDFEDDKSRGIEPYWNDLEYFDQNTKLLHFTDMDKQPWISKANPLRQIWLNELQEAVENNFITIQELIEASQKGDISPDILDYILNGSKRTTISSFFYAPPHTVARFFKSNNLVTRGITLIAIKIKRTLFK